MNENESLKSISEKYAKLLKDYREVTGKKLSIEARHVINVLDASGDWVFPEAVADALKVTKQRAKFLLERLVDSKHIRMGGLNGERYMIEQKGRMAVHGTSA